MDLPEAWTMKECSISGQLTLVGRVVKGFVVVVHQRRIPHLVSLVPVLEAKP